MYEAQDRFEIDLFLLGLLGLWIGSIIGAMSDIVPYQLMFMLGLALVVSVWQAGVFSLLTLAGFFGVFVGGTFGAMSAQIPWGIPLVALICGIMMIFRGKVFQTGSSSVPSLVTIPLLMIAVGGIFYNFTYTDFCLVNSVDVCSSQSNWVNGFPTSYNGCIADCTVNLFSIFGSSVFSNLIVLGSQGDYIGMISSFFVGSFQTAITIISFAMGIIMILLGSGIGVAVLGTTISVNEAGTRFYQSLGLSTIIFSIIFGLFGGWLTTIFAGPISSGPFLFGTSFFFLVTGMYYYGAYLQGKTGAG